jgi:hypothetical protein
MAMSVHGRGMTSRRDIAHIAMARRPWTLPLVNVVSTVVEATRNQRIATIRL